MFYLQKNKMKVTNIKMDCIIEIKIMNKTQCIGIHKSHIILLYIYLKFPRIK